MALIKFSLFFLAAFLFGYFYRGTAQEKSDGLTTLTRRVGPPRLGEAGESATPSAVVRRQARVTRVIDGDTVVLADGRHVRYLGINSPELRERWGEAAKKFNA